MKAHLRRSLPLVALVALVTILTVAVGVGMVVSAEEPVREAATVDDASAESSVSPAFTVPGGPGFFSSHASACMPSSSSVQYNLSSWNLTASGSTATFLCPVYLPNGATINKLVVTYYDNSAEDLSASLRRLWAEDLNAWYGTIASVASSGANGNNRYSEDDASSSSALVDNQTYSYFVSVTLPPTTAVRLLNFRVDYQYGAYLPAVMNNSNLN